MIGAYLILYNDISDGKLAKVMTIAKSNIDDVSKSGPSNTFFVELIPTSFGKETNKVVLSINRTLLNVHDNIWYKDKFKIATKVTFSI